MAMQSKKDLDSVFGALAHSTRRGMLALLARGDRTAGELGEPFRISQPAASKHIRSLEQAKLVSRLVEGRVHRFHFENEPLEAAEVWIARHRKFWDHSLAGLDQVLREMQKDRRP